jgi:hypothetical protein
LRKSNSKEAQESDWMRPMTRAVFRHVGDNGVAVNFYVPDVIFDRSGTGEKLAKITYEKCYNVLSQSLAFVRCAGDGRRPTQGFALG